ncbi:SSU rRNA (adenine(1518)-N(6)/adenine(1519)-N(6))-dimethyltransferase [hydrothermal vent metagenome]|uniref:SSU rRNA (Adenine(1518)-N(6)/adenine(1519)-N(6))-dimethyltransferase n=1 Tax=hydrothermal vent metagenome TaxID=652676 RepID=A0A3B1CK07_9ZZZZ
MSAMRGKQKKLGQCFLVDESVTHRIVTEASVGSGAKILEIGPGKGILTRALLDAGFTVHAIELDRLLYDYLKKEFAGDDRLTLERCNALKFDYRSITAPYHVISNLPYSVSVPIINKLLENLDVVASMTLMTQAEVAKRLTAQPGDSLYGSLSVHTAYYCKTELLFNVPPDVFRPKPKVESSVIRLTPLKNPPIETDSADEFFRFVKSSFLHRRKTLKNNISQMWHSVEAFYSACELAGIAPTIRPEEISIQEFGALFSDLVRKN